jgi:hypothetical protein
METTLTMENLLAIFQAMDRIKPIDRSDYFNNYYQEIVSRLQNEKKMKSWIESKLKLTGQQDEKLSPEHILNAVEHYFKLTGQETSPEKES